MPEFESVRSTAEAIGRVFCIKTGEEIGLLYRWNNGEAQVALNDGGLAIIQHHSDNPTEPSIGPKRTEQQI